MSTLFEHQATMRKAIFDATYRDGNGTYWTKARDEPDQGRATDGMQVELRADSTHTGRQYLHGRAVPYEAEADIGWFLESHAGGSLSKSINEAARSLPLLAYHQAGENPIGVLDSWDDGTAGLDGIWKLDTSDRAQEIARLTEPDDDGNAMLGYLSIGFSPIRSKWTFVDDWNPDLGPGFKDSVRRLESRLLEVSVVPAPAFKEAITTMVRNAGARQSRQTANPTRKLDAWREQLDALRAG